MSSLNMLTARGVAGKIHTPLTDLWAHIWATFRHARQQGFVAVW